MPAKITLRAKELVDWSVLEVKSMYTKSVGEGALTGKNVGSADDYVSRKAAYVKVACSISGLLNIFSQHLNKKIIIII